MTIDEYNTLYNEGRLRSGYTTGTCACAAAKAALLLLLGKDVEAVTARLPGGVELKLEVYDKNIENEEASCAVYKYAGDDPDVTDSLLIYAKVAFIERKEVQNNEKFKKALLDRDIDLSKKTSCIFIDGAFGVGVVTRPGLDRAPGESAINTVPRKMIRENLWELVKQYDIKDDIFVSVYVPEGREKAKKTFNEKLGIIGGISILGTTGIVNPMSRQALIDTIKVDMKMNYNISPYIVAVPGNYGINFLRTAYAISELRTVEFSNYIGEAIDIAVNLGVKGLLLVGHLGKFVKLAGGIMNTHSNDADARNELIAAHLIKIKSSLSSQEVLDLAKKILEANTTTEDVALLKEKGVLTEVMAALTESMYKYSCARAKKAFIFNKREGEPDMKIGIITYTLEEGELASCGYVKEIISKI